MTTDDRNIPARDDSADEEPIGYEGADVQRVYEQAHYDGEPHAAPEETADDEPSVEEPAGEPEQEAVAERPQEKHPEKHGDIKKVAGAAGAAVVLAATLGTAGIDTDKVTLPEPTPIVQTYDIGSGAAVPDSPDAVDSEDEKKSSIWELFVKMLKYLILLVIAIVALVFALLKGCASCVGPVVGPDDDDEEKQEQPADETATADAAFLARYGIVL